MSKMIKSAEYKVTLEMWRETWRGNDQRDGIKIINVKAKDEREAIELAKKIATDPGKGNSWSHSIWTKNERAEKIDG